MPVEAHIIEPLGAYDIVDLKVGEQLLRARTPSGFVAKAGDTVWAKLDAAQTHFFDTAIRRVARHQARRLTWPQIRLENVTKTFGGHTARRRPDRSTSPTASSSCCSGRPAPARPRRCA